MSNWLAERGITRTLVLAGLLLLAGSYSASLAQQRDLSLPQPQNAPHSSNTQQTPAFAGIQEPPEQTKEIPQTYLGCWRATLGPQNFDSLVQPPDTEPVAKSTSSICLRHGIAGVEITSDTMSSQEALDRGLRKISGQIHLVEGSEEQIVVETSVFWRESADPNVIIQSAARWVCKIPGDQQEMLVRGTMTNTCWGNALHCNGQPYMEGSWHATFNRVRDPAPTE